MTRSTGPAGALLLLLLACTLAAGCGGRLPVTHYYVLEAADAAVAPASPGLEIGVRAFRVAAPYDQDRIVYRVGEDSSELGFYAYHRWAAPLARMLPVAIADGLRGATGVGSIEPAMPGRRYGAWLEGRVGAVEEIDLADGQRVRLSMTLRLTDDAGGLLWSKTLDAAASARTDEVGVLVEAMNELLRDELASARDELARALVSR
jgi:uncharacterized lipoprotein YmbA